MNPSSTGKHQASPAKKFNAPRGRHSTEVAFETPTNPGQVRFSVFSEDFFPREKELVVDEMALLRKVKIGMIMLIKPI